MPGADVAALVTLIALIIAVLQVFQQYASSAVARSKVNTSALGRRALLNRYSWSFREWKLRIAYPQAELRISTALPMMGLRNPSTLKIELTHPDYVFGWGVQVIEGPLGPRPLCAGEMTIRRRGDESQSDISPSVLSFRQQLKIRRIDREMVTPGGDMSPCKATWYNFMVDLGLDPCKMSPDPAVYIDAETIATALDAPVMFMQMSELILFGLLLDMEITKFSLKERVLDMIGRHSNISTIVQQGVGTLVRYSGLSTYVQPTAFTCSAPELMTLIRTASGALHIGDSAIAMNHLGYNTVDHILMTALERIPSERWIETQVVDVMGNLDGDDNIRWAGRWAEPEVPAVAFLLCLCANLTVCNSFPHRLLHGWTNDQRKHSARIAYQHLQESIGFIEAPTKLFQTMREMKLDLLVMDGYKTANDWGSEHGGLRGWLCSNLAQFTLRMSHCWPVDGPTEQVPILPQLRTALMDGTLDAEWGRHYDLNLGQFDRGPGWWMNASSLFWIQIMIFDTWIARRVETIMMQDSKADPAVPVDTDSAIRSTELNGNGHISTGWKRSRVMFARMYLKRLAEGYRGLGCSFLSTGSREEQIGEGWFDMLFGTARDWADVDAVLTLRSIMMAVRLEFMKDSSPLLELQRLDPIIQMG